MNIFFIHYLENIGGGERYLINLINAIPENYNIYLLTPNSDTMLEKEITRPFTKISKKFKRNFFAFPYFSISLLYFIYKFIKENKINIIHLNDHYLLPSFIPIKYFFNIKIIFTSHGIWDSYFFINRFILKLLNPIVLTATPIQYFRIKFLVKKIFLMPFFHTNINQLKIKEVDNGINLGIIGRFSPVKNHTLAFEIVENSDYILHIFGGKTLNISEESSEYERKLLNLINKNKNIIYHGFNSNLEEIYKNIDMLLVTSKTESFSMVTIEALSFGIPVISTLTEGSSFIINNGYNGFICNSKNEFIEKIEFIKNNYEKFSKNALESCHKFSKETYIKQLMDIYEN